MWRASPGTRAALAGLGVLVLLAVVGLASRGGLGSAGMGVGPSHGLLSYAFTIFLVLLVVGTPLRIWVFVVQRGNQLRSGRKSRMTRAVANGLVLLVFVLIALALVRLRQHGGNGVHIRVPHLPSAGSGGRAGAAQPRPAPSFEWPVVAVLAAVALAGVVAGFVARRRRGKPRAPLAHALSLALDDAIGDVAGETDPRRAVIKAYARAETVLAAHGLPRDPAETPYEYLARALEGLEASAASVERLTALFERARFSRHEIGEGMRGEAIAALTAVRDELRREE